LKDIDADYVIYIANSTSNETNDENTAPSIYNTLPRNEVIKHAVAQQDLLKKHERFLQLLKENFSKEPLFQKLLQGSGLQELYPDF
jgi:hypothetical protein